MRLEILFIVSLTGALILVPFHFWSVEHRRLDARFGSEKGQKIGKVLGIVSGWGYFLFLFGIWLSPQAIFVVPLLDDIPVLTLESSISVSLGDLILGTPFLFLGIWFGIKGVRDLGLEVSETHRAKSVVTTGIYSKVRHPQYLGAIFSHIGISLLLSAFYSLLVTPVLILRDFIVSRKEEQQMELEFGEEYAMYKREVPMLIPRVRVSQKR
ncbi:MAG: methyltransferase family protein [Candidatus Thorarchaeota archaeon]